MLCEAKKKCTSLKNSTLLFIKLNTSSIQYFLQCQWLLSLSRYCTQFYGKYGLLQSSSKCHSKLSWSMNSQNPSWYSSLKSISISPSYIHTGLLNGPFPSIFQSIICYILPRTSIPQYLTSTINYQTPHYASFSSHSVYSSNIILTILFSNNQLINGKKHSPVLKTRFMLFIPCIFYNTYF